MPPRLSLSHIRADSELSKRNGSTVSLQGILILFMVIYPHEFDVFSLSLQPLRVSFTWTLQATLTNKKKLKIKFE